MNHIDFFRLHVPHYLTALTADTKALWGTMNAMQMIDHLTAGTHLFMAKQETALEVPQEKVARYKAFLMSDKPFMENAPKPALYARYEGKSRGEMATRKAAFLEALATFDAQTSTDLDFWSFHPSFGRLHAEETRQLQYKHIRHHFQQFGLMPK